MAKITYLNPKKTKISFIYTKLASFSLRIILKFRGENSEVMDFCSRNKQPPKALSRPLLALVFHASVPGVGFGASSP